jgi:hypothetical protein
LAALLAFIHQTIPIAEYFDSFSLKIERSSVLQVVQLCCLLFFPYLKDFLGGVPIPVGDLPGWTQIFFDDFSLDAPIGTFLNSNYINKWDAYPDGWVDSSYGTYSPTKTLSAVNGTMDIYVHSENGIHFGCVPMVRLRGPNVSAGEGILYGKFSYRLRYDTMPGYHIAWNLFPDSNFYSDGEIVCPEIYTDGTESRCQNVEPVTDISDFFEMSGNLTLWHTYTIEWTPGKVIFYLDDIAFGNATTKVANTSLHWIFQTESDGQGEPLNLTEGHIQVDWVVAYMMAVPLYDFRFQSII